MSDTAITILPRKILEEWNISPRTREKLARLEAYDLSHLTENFIDKGARFSPEQIWPILEHFGKADLEIARLLEQEFKKFVALTLVKPGQVYAPSGPVDMYWHFFVLHTREYASFCSQVWGTAPDHGKLPATDEDALRVAIEKASLEQKKERSAQECKSEALDDPQALCSKITLVPQGVLQSLPKEALQKLYLLEHYDLSFFTDHLVDQNRIFSPEQVWPLKAHFGKVDLEVTRLIEHEFKKWVALTLLEPGMVFAPSGPVDMYWHFMILHTAEYREFCQDIWGSYQHHPRGSQHETQCDDPSADHLDHYSPTMHEKVKNAYAQTLALYEKVFGPRNEGIWLSEAPSE